MHRGTPFMNATRAFSAGGTRAVVDKVDDTTLMQEMGGTHLKNETNKNIESPQNYGFTSVVMPGTKDKDGNVTEGAEAFISYMGGNRSFAVCQVMDDRRYRLKELENGDVAWYDHQQQQMHMNKDGTFLTGLNEKKIRLQLADVDQQQQGGQQGGGGGAALGVEAQATSGASSSQSSGQQQKAKGQKARYKKESKRYVDIDKDRIENAHDKAVVHKAPKHTFEGNVVIKGELYVTNDIKGGKNLRINLEGYKPSNDLWVAGSAGGAPSDDSPDGLGIGGGGVESLNADQLAHLEYKKQVRNRVRIDPDGTVTVEGDFVVTGNLIVNGVVRAKGFETVT